MANAHSIIPLDGSELTNSALDYVIDRMVYSIDSLPKGRFPTLVELRQVIQELDYTLEETHDWYVTSDNDHTEIWFSGETREENSPTKFWFRRGSIIVLDIMQKLANQCGSFLVLDHSGAVAIFIVPDSVFGTISQPEDGFGVVMSQRVPVIVERLGAASLDDTLFLLSQIRQALSSLYEVWRYDLFQSAHRGLPIFAQCLKHHDPRVRFLAFDLISILKQEFFTYAEALGEAIKAETDIDTKTRMVWSIKDHIVGRLTNSVDQWTQALLDALMILVDNDTEARPVRLAAANMLARAKLGFLTPAIRTIFIDALIQPEQYQSSWNSDYTISRDILKSIEHLLLHDRIIILLAALPRIVYAQDAHEVLHALLDTVFYGETRDFNRSSLLDTQKAERPNVEETKFRDHLRRAWYYPVNSVRLTIGELMPFQRQILDTVISLDVPWMVHSNLLEKYGLPATRSELRAMLNDLFSEIS